MIIFSGHSAVVFHVCVAVFFEFYLLIYSAVLLPVCLINLLACLLEVCIAAQVMLV